jgi:hypothetical protein
MLEFMQAFPGLTQAMRVADFVAGAVIQAIQLFIFLCIFPFAVAIWCFYHPHLASYYATSGMYALATTDWATRGALALMILFALLIPRATRRFAGLTLKTAFAVGVICYIIACF